MANTEFRTNGNKSFGIPSKPSVSTYYKQNLPYTYISSTKLHAVSTKPDNGQVNYINSKHYSQQKETHKLKISNLLYRYSIILILQPVYTKENFITV